MAGRLKGSADQNNVDGRARCRSADDSIERSISMSVLKRTVERGDAEAVRSEITKLAEPITVLSKLIRS